MYIVFLKITKPVWLNTYKECIHESENDSESESESEKDSMHIRHKISSLTFDGNQPACLCHFLQYAVKRRKLHWESCHRPFTVLVKTHIYIYTYLCTSYCPYIVKYSPRVEKILPERACQWGQYFFYPRGISYSLGNNRFIILVWDVIKRRIYRV